MRQNATLQAVVEHYAELLDFLSARTGSRDQARDCAQETWVRLAQSSPAPHKGGVLENVKAYVFRVAEHIAIDHHRFNARQGRLHTEYSHHRAGDMAADTAEVAALRQTIQRLTDAIMALPLRTQEIFLLHKIEGHGYAEIASMQGITTSAVEKHMMRVLLTCRQAMQDANPREVKP